MYSYGTRPEQKTKPDKVSRQTGALRKKEGHNGEYLPRTKNESERTVPLSPAAIGILRELENGEADGPVFGMAAMAITHAYMKACKRAGIEDLTFHDLRHEATSRLFENTDLDVMEIRSITGHRSMQMLARYSHLRTHRLADRLAGVRRGGGEKVTL